MKWERGILAACPWKELVLVLLLLGVLHLINDSAQDGLSCWNLPPFNSASPSLLLALLFGSSPSPHPNLSLGQTTGPG